MMLIAAMTASLVTSSGRSAWFVGVLVLLVYLIFAMTLYLLPPRLQSEGTKPRNVTEHSNHLPERSACCANFL
jgi:Ca2+:H+ antiporter